jgi:light-regulated signal transduction histidine kinase (bacteriophytochrome)
MRLRYEDAIRFVKSKSIWLEYPTFAIDSEENDLVTIMSFIEKIYPDKAIIVCQRSPSPSVQYVSANCKSLFGLEANTIMKMTLPDFLDFIHPEDIQDVNQCYAFINDKEPYNPTLYRFEMFYRWLYPAGHHITICEVKMAIQNHKGEFIYLNLYHDASLEVKFHAVSLHVYQRINDNYKKISTYHPRRKSSVFTPRQSEIANLIHKGLTN